jgi:hypothetical protein
MQVHPPSFRYGFRGAPLFPVDRFFRRNSRPFLYLFNKLLSLT